MPPVSLAPQGTLPLFPFAPRSDGIVRVLEAHVDWLDDRVLRFQYRLTAELGRIRMPGRRAPRQADELWKHTCFEAFVALATDIAEGAGFAPRAGAATPVTSAGYRELNFAPSTEWAVYAFDGYRTGMLPVTMQQPPDIRVEASAERLHVDARVDTRTLFARNESEPRPKLRIALAAVIEDGSGTITHWALKHAPTKADFHHPAGFILEV